MLKDLRTTVHCASSRGICRSMWVELRFSFFFFFRLLLLSSTEQLGWWLKCKYKNRMERSVQTKDQPQRLGQHPQQHPKKPYLPGHTPTPTNMHPDYYTQYSLPAQMGLLWGGKCWFMFLHITGDHWQTQTLSSVCDGWHFNSALLSQLLTQSSSQLSIHPHITC